MLVFSRFFALFLKLNVWQPLVHCCYYISLLPGWWNIVQNGDPLYAAEDYKRDCGGHIWPNRVQFFAKNTLLISQLLKKNYLGPKKIIFGALGRHFFQTLVTFHKLRIFQKLRIKIVESMLSLNTYHYQTAFKTWGFFQKMRINPHFLKALFKADLLVRWLQASTGTFQKVRIESSILENSPKSTMGRVYHPFLGGKKS